MKRTSIMEHARWDVYFALDKIRGGSIANIIRNNRYAMCHGTSMAETDLKLRALIQHAVSTTEYYAGINPDTPLSEFPLVNKKLYMEQYDRFRSREYLHARDNRVMYTSGSTGTPFGMVQNRDKIIHDRADGIFLSMAGGYHIGQKMAFIRIWVDGNKKNRLQLLMENSIMVDTASLDDFALDKMLNTLKKKRVKCIISYSSALIAISKYIRETGYDTSGFSICSIIPISEYMPPEIRTHLSRVFNCRVQSWYSNEENGIMGIQGKQSSSYYINSESYYYEILKMDSDEPAADGELGRIVITDLYNYAFPIIRYDNGDTAIAKHQFHGDRYKLFLTDLYGRRLDIIYNTAGEPVSPYVIYFNLWDVKNIRQYRFVQTGIQNYELQLNAEHDLVDTEKIINNIKPSFGEDAIITVKFVDEIPVLASGKRKFVENLCPEYLQK